MAARQSGVLVAAIVLALACAASAQTLSAAKNAGSCNTRFNQTLAAFYGNDQACANLIYVAFNGTVKAQCPPTTVGSPLHLCMNKNNTGATADAWANLISSCDYLYIANRQGSGESETGFTYNDQTCFQAFSSWGAFASWLYDASAYGGVAKSPGGAANMAQVALGTIAAALAFALMLILQ